MGPTAVVVWLYATANDPESDGGLNRRPRAECFSPPKWLTQTSKVWRASRPLALPAPPPPPRQQDTLTQVNSAQPNPIFDIVIIHTLSLSPLVPPLCCSSFSLSLARRSAWPEERTRRYSPLRAVAWPTAKALAVFPLPRRGKSPPSFSSAAVVPDCWHAKIEAK